MEIKSNKGFIIITLSIIVIFALYLAFLIYVTWPISEWSINKAGVLGDSFNVLTSLFSGLAFAGLIWTINLQRNDLKIQQEQLSLQLKEMRDSKKEMENQTRIQRAQFHAEISNIRIAAKLATVEALKLEAEYADNTVGRSRNIDTIKEISKYIASEADCLSKNVLD